MFGKLNTLAIEVTETISQSELDAMAKQAAEAKEKTFWFLFLVLFLIAEIAFAVFFPKYLEKRQVKKDAEAMRKAERKRIQSQRRKKY